jgi:hypothetical protein
MGCGASATKVDCTAFASSATPRTRPMIGQPYKAKQPKMMTVQQLQEKQFHKLYCDLTRPDPVSQPKAAASHADMLLATHDPEVYPVQRQDSPRPCPVSQIQVEKVTAFNSHLKLDLFLAQIDHVDQRRRESAAQRSQGRSGIRRDQ